MTESALPDFSSELEGGQKLCVMPVPRLLLHAPSKNIFGCNLYPTGSFDLDELHIVSHPAYEFAEAQRKGTKIKRAIPSDSLAMTTSRTSSEEVFETFLSRHRLPFEPILTADSPRPDYLVTSGAVKIIFEVKELSEDENFSQEPLTVSSRIVGDHIRSKIANSRKQIQWGTAQGSPSVLLVYNNLDTAFHMFGTEDHDFLCAMYGEYTLAVDKATGHTRGLFHGRTHSLAEQKNTSFSALGRLSPLHGEMKVTLFENAFAKLPISYDQLPPCFDVLRVEIAR